MQFALSDGYQIRRPQPTDAETVQTLVVASDISEFGESSGYSLDELKDDWSRLDLENDAWLAIGPGGEIAGYAFAQQRRHIRFDSEVYVHPEHFGCGIGTAMIRLAEERAREWVPSAPPGVRLAVRNWINAQNADARSLLEREGYCPARYFWRMEAQVGEGEPGPVWPEGITVRVVAPDEDLRMIYETSEEAMADHWGHVPSTFEDWRERRTGHGFDSSLWFLAMAGEEPAGVALCGVSDGNGWVNTLAVRRPWRRQGVGMALLRHSFDAFHRRGTERVDLVVDSESPTGATRLYEQAGMRVSQHYAAFEKVLREGVEPEVEGEVGATVS
jgi:GNAT superfamily N-acetyltransferase